MHTRTTRRQFRLQRQTFSIWRLCWRPYWISQLAIIYANLCRQFQKLQTIGNILIYDSSCCTRGSGLPLERVASFTHCHPTIESVYNFGSSFWMYMCLTILSYVHSYSCVRTITWIYINGFSPNLVCALIL